MDNRPVVFIDSGIGGLPYCRVFSARNPHEEICYIADRENFPYGSRSKEELVSILTALTEKIIKTINPKIAVLACNTAAVSALAALRQNFPQLPLVGTVPAIKPAANASKSGKVGLLGTARTIEDPYNQNIAGANCEIITIAAPELVEFVEQRFSYAEKNERTEIARKYIELFCAAGADTLVLGCTHFLYLMEEFRREAAPLITVFDSLDGITKRIEFLINEENDGALRAGEDAAPLHRLLLTGTKLPDSLWQDRAKALSFNAGLLCEL
jgi:glutamate racemase